MTLLERARRNDRAQGMTFIEIAIALLIIGILITLVGPAAYRQLTRTYRLKTDSVLRSAKLGITQFHSDTGQYPNTLYDLAFKPSDAKIAQRWKGEYLTEKEIEMDGWGNEIMYHKNAPGQKKRPYELYSWGPNGEGSPKDEWIDAWNL